MPKNFYRFLIYALFTALSPVGYTQITDIPEYSFRFSGPAINALENFGSRYSLFFYYQNDWFASDSITANFRNKPLNEAISLLLKGKPFAFRIIPNNHIIILPADKVAQLTNTLENYAAIDTDSLAFIQIGSPGHGIRKKGSQVKGIVVDAKTNEPVIGAIIQVNNLPLGAVTNVQGEYNLTLDAGFYTLSVSSVGYEKNEYHVKVNNNGVLNMELFDRSIEFEDVVIRSERLDKNISSHQMSIVELDAKFIRQLPTVSGSTDVIKGLVTIPGVKSIGEFSSGINVRGGGEDQNLYLFNGAPIFNTTHVFGLLSVINPDAVNKLTLYKGHIPSMYGERVSSLIDIRSSDLYPDKFSVTGGIGIYDGRIHASVPVIKNHLFFEIGGRTNYSNWILKNSNDPYLKYSRSDFHDLNGTVHLQFSKSRISLSGYSSHDGFNLGGDVNYLYNSRLGSLNWNIMHGSDMASYISISGSSYDVEQEIIDIPEKSSTAYSGIQHNALRYRLKYSAIDKHNLDAGFNFIIYQVKPGKLVPAVKDHTIRDINLPAENAYEGALYVNDEFIVNTNVTLNLGLRMSTYKHEDSDPAFGLEPRLSTRIQLNTSSSVKLSYNRNFQYLSLISPSAVSMPGDVWKLSNNIIRPLQANQIALGYYRNFLNNSVETSVEAYYKRLDHLIEYEEGVALSMNPDLEKYLYDASGVNYGVELLLRKNTGRWQGWMGYTYSRSFREINDPEIEKQLTTGRYPSSFDKPHDFTLVATYYVNRRVHITGNFSYSTGRPVTLPEQKATVDNVQIVVFSKKNQYRIPDYHRLDLAISFDESLKIRKKWKGRLTFSLLNVYGRDNPYTVYYTKDKASIINEYNTFGMYMLYLIGKPLPTISYSFRF